MKSKASFISAGMLHNDFKRYGWLGIAYLLLLLAVVPLRLLMKYSQPEGIKMYYGANAYLQVFQFDYSPGLSLLLLVFPVLTALLLFRYLQSSNAADLQHSLPLQRGTLYNTHLLTGFIILLAPVLLTALASWALLSGLGIDSVESQDVVAWLIILVLGNLLFFATAAVIGMFTGLSTLQGALTYILLLVPTGLTSLLVDNLNIYLFGFSREFYMFGIDRFSPLLRLPMSRSPLQNGEIILYLFILIALYLLGGYLYRRRQIERAGDAITFGALRPVFKYSVVFCSMLLLGSYFYHSQQSIAWTYFGYALGAFLSYFLIEALLNKSLQVFDLQRFKGLGLYSLLVILLIALLHSGTGPYEKKLPDIAQVENIYFDYSLGPLLRADDPGTWEYQHYRLPIYRDSENIAHVMDLHQAIIDYRQEEKDHFTGTYTSGREHIHLVYQLNNGKRMYRYYAIDPSFYHHKLKPIYESSEYKYNRYELLRVDPAEIKLVEVGCYEANKRVNITDPQLVVAAVAALQKDIYAATYEEERLAGIPPWGYIELILPQGKDNSNRPMATSPETAGIHQVVGEEPYYNVSLPWQKSYQNFEQWLKSVDLYEQARLLPGADITHAILEYFPEGLGEADYRASRKGGEYMGEGPGRLKITDPNELELCLRNYQGQYAPGPLYRVAFKLRNGSLISGLLTPATVPAFVKQHFGG